MKNFFKKFPLTTYAAIVIILFFVFKGSIHPEENFIIFIIFSFLALPLTAVNQIYIIFGIQNEIFFLFSPIFSFLVIDLLILYFRLKLIPKFKSKKNNSNS